MSKTVNTKNSNDIVEEMFAVGAHYGYSKTRRHPSVSPFIYGSKNRTDIIDLEKTSEMLKTALEFVKTLGAKNKTLLLIGTKPEAKEAIESAGIELDMPYVAERWIGGTISNFSEIKKRIAELENYRKESKEGGLEKYTKKERSVMAKKMEKLSKYYSGLITLKKMPDAVFVIDPRAEDIATAEAEKSHLPVIGLANSDSNISGLTYPILANDANLSSVKLFTKMIVSAYKEGRDSAPQKIEEK